MNIAWRQAQSRGAAKMPPGWASAIASTSGAASQSVPHDGAFTDRLAVEVLRLGIIPEPEQDRAHTSEVGVRHDAVVRSPRYGAVCHDGLRIRDKG